MEERTARLDVMSTLDGAETAMTGRARIKLYASHIYYEWGVNRQNGTLPAFERGTIAYADIPPEDNRFGYSIGRLIDDVEAYQVRGRQVFKVIAWSWQKANLDLEDVARVIRELELARDHKQLFFRTISIEAFEHWLHGFSAGCAIAGLTLNHTPGGAFQAVVEERGWQFLAALPWREMKERGLSDEEVIDELLTIEIEAWRRTFDL